MAELTAHIHLDGSAIVVQAIREAMEHGKYIMLYLDEDCLQVSIFDKSEDEADAKEPGDGYAREPDPEVIFHESPKCRCYIESDGGRCMGTREMDRVNCGGDELKCDFREKEGTAT